jgi:hypothetical protein
MSMAFAYYNRLSKQQRAIYRRSAAIGQVPLPRPDALQPLAQRLQAALHSQSRHKVCQACQQLGDALLRQLDSVPVHISVRERRPSNDWEELHGYYEPLAREKTASITLYMRTAKRGQVVAFRTFLRTLLHELCHHLDYEYFELPESYHTEGFYQRESSLFYQIIGSARSRQTA